MAASSQLVVFERDLRIADQAALRVAAKSGPVIAVFCMDTALEKALGGAQKWWLYHSLSSLDNDLSKRGGQLVILKGRDRAEQLIEFCQANAIGHVHWTERLEVYKRNTDAELAGKLEQAGIKAFVYSGPLLHQPRQVRTKTGGPFRVYTPFWRAIQPNLDEFVPAPAPSDITFAAVTSNLTIADLNLLPTKPDWSAGFAASWQPGEAGAHKRLNTFLSGALVGYQEYRNRPDIEATSKLSPHLAFGEISPRQVVAAALKQRGKVPADDLEVFLKEMVWREFSYHLLDQKPDLAVANFNQSFDRFPWDQNQDVLKAWQKGMTGYPIVDAGMRELWQTGWMHNRVRMIVASFLTKHALLDWREGERWFWDTLVDADPASNAASWQWVSGSGADAAPYFRVFNPVLQGEKFDPNGDYVRKYVPELAKLPTAFLQNPWDAPLKVLISAGVRLGETYPNPIVNHEFGRQRALAAYQTLKAAS
jgi:deoxyribodipyrimidine photo-lyase